SLFRYTTLFRSDWDYDAIKNGVFQYVQTHKAPLAPSGIRRRFMRWVPYAAVLLLALAIGYFFLEQSHRVNNPDIIATKITPGGNRATLTLADGRTVDLSEAQSGIV